MLGYQLKPRFKTKLAVYISAQKSRFGAEKSICEIVFLAKEIIRDRKKSALRKLYDECRSCKCGHPTRWTMALGMNSVVNNAWGVRNGGTKPLICMERGVREN